MSKEPTIQGYLNGKVTYDRDCQYFWITKNNDMKMLAELRGWGAIQNLFKDKSGKIDMELAAKFQDEIGEFIANAIDDKIQKFKIKTTMTPQEAAEQYALKFKTQASLEGLDNIKDDFLAGQQWQSEQDNQALSSALKEIAELHAKLRELQFELDNANDYIIQMQRGHGANG